MNKPIFTPEQIENINHTISQVAQACGNLAIASKNAVEALERFAKELSVKSSFPVSRLGIPNKQQKTLKVKSGKH
ncbi:hypothetical protein H6G45_06510 [Synechocystis sp. FACHB-383]|uniref:hypothetical protein n=1 Tax=Synechocystis sp. FACHB-383 TaxID=2692864 RepID=UPI001682B07C|nr:hypothetical protein [Synechocystis sp. FACHB-383]MBD2653145.1 hypothetical protein [Synechocystis sp. FACHB-383]